MASDTVPISLMAHEQNSHSAVENDEHIDPEVKGGECILRESEHPETLEEGFKSGGNVGEGEEDLAGDDDAIDLDLNTAVGSEDLDTIIPLYFECEDIMSDSKQSSNFVEIDLNMAMDPLLVEEEEEAPPLLQLSSSKQPSERSIDLNDDPFVLDYVPDLNILDSRMIIDKMDELSARAFIMGMKDSTHLYSTWIPDLNLDYGMLQIENGGCDEGSLMHLFMPETGNLLREERKETDSGFVPYGSDYDQLRLKL